ncbi:AMP-binding protein [Flagellimonas eckloniae]|uniref:O-succinylbenzoic acid--CoA ligase n=1 Tax=Flagellimonas eckloniae TaxID=346185 RepID=A0A0Q1H6J1_9FLAO|nr:AMP-binding protein [Allomuricauda eckloniae]KQC29269.1 O-succinylbenzoic acid--CoA ligase [Allomuricauda eckloniae]
MNPTWHNIHPHFKLNGIHYSIDELPEIGYSLIKEGKPFEGLIGDFLLDWISESPTLEVLTSGSTGKPKKIVLKKEHMVNSAMATGSHFNMDSGKKALLCLPCSGIAGKMMLVRAMVLGWELDYMEPSSEPLANTTKVYDFSAMVPLQAEKSLEKLSQIKTLIIGGASISSNLKEKLYSIPSNIFETYGMTETITHIAVKRIDDSSVRSSGVETYFNTLPNIKVSTDERGCLVIDAPTIANAKVVTNDIVELIDETHFKWLGRYDSIINSGGVKLIPEQIEEKLSKIIMSRFFIAGIPDEALGQKLVLLVEVENLDKEELLQKIKALDSITRYEVPKEIYAISSFVETKSNKVNRSKTMETLFG